MKEWTTTSVHGDKWCLAVIISCSGEINSDDLSGRYLLSLLLWVSSRWLFLFLLVFIIHFLLGFGYIPYVVSRWWSCAGCYGTSECSLMKTQTETAVHSDMDWLGQMMMTICQPRSYSSHCSAAFCLISSLFSMLFFTQSGVRHSKCCCTKPPPALPPRLLLAWRQPPASNSASDISVSPMQ